MSSATLEAQRADIESPESIIESLTLLLQSLTQGVDVRMLEKAGLAYNIYQLAEKNHTIDQAELLAQKAVIH